MNFLDSRLPDRFWNKCTPEPNSGCWLWTGCTSQRGYGRFNRGGGIQQAHRVSFSALVSQIPNGLELDHLCRERSCCNPAHLEPVSHYENIMRGQAPAALLASMTACRNGHPFNEENALFSIRDSGRLTRRCRVCRRKPKKAK